MDDNQTFDIFQQGKNLTLSDISDPDINYFNNKLQETKILTTSEAKHFFKENQNKFSILNINIRSMNKNFDSLKSMLHNLNFSFKIICITETWCQFRDILPFISHVLFL